MMAIMPYHGETRHGDVVSFFHLGSLDVGVCLSSFTKRGFVQANVAFLEFLSWNCDRLSVRTGWLARQASSRSRPPPRP